MKAISISTDSLNSTLTRPTVTSIPIYIVRIVDVDSLPLQSHWDDEQESSSLYLPNNVMRKERVVNANRKNGNTTTHACSGEEWDLCPGALDRTLSWYECLHNPFSDKNYHVWFRLNDAHSLMVEKYWNTFDWSPYSLNLNMTIRRPPQNWQRLSRTKKWFELWKNNQIVPKSIKFTHERCEVYLSGQQYYDDENIEMDKLRTDSFISSPFSFYFYFFAAMRFVCLIKNNKYS